MSVNRMTVIGRLGADPEMKETRDGTSLARLSIATERGGDSEETDWHRATAWDRLAEVCEEYLSKGDRVYLAGSLTYSRWEDDAGQKRKTAELQIRKLEMLGGSGDSRKPTKEEKVHAGATEGDGEYSEFSDDALMGDDDLPF